MGKGAVTFLLLLGIGCSSHVPFTTELANQLSDEEVRNLQFYVSSKVVLRRDLSSSDKRVTSTHSVLTEHGRQIEEVTITKRVPGVAIGREKGKRISVSFEAPVNGQELFILFQANQGRYFLLDQIKVMYGPKEFEVVRGFREAFIEVEADVVERVDSRRRKASGRVLEPSE